MISSIKLSKLNNKWRKRRRIFITWSLNWLTKIAIFKSNLRCHSRLSHILLKGLGRKQLSLPWIARLETILIMKTLTHTFKRIKMLQFKKQMKAWICRPKRVRPRSGPFTMTTIVQSIYFTKTNLVMTLKPQRSEHSIS